MPADAPAPRPGDRADPRRRGRPRRRGAGPRGADAVVVTPAHQFPTGAVMPAERRAALVAWADAGSRVILEDDYDAEYRYDREPIGAIQGLAPEQVIYAGSASKTWRPACASAGSSRPPPRRPDRDGEGDQRPRLARPRPARLRRLPGAGRASTITCVGCAPSIAPGATSCSTPSTTAPGAAAGRGLGGAASCSPGCRRGRRGRRRRRRGGRRRRSTACRATATGPAGAGGLIFGYGAVLEDDIVEGVRVVGRVVDEATISGAIAVEPEVSAPATPSASGDGTRPKCCQSVRRSGRTTISTMRPCSKRCQSASRLNATRRPVGGTDPAVVRSGPVFVPEACQRLATRSPSAT